MVRCCRTGLRFNVTALPAAWGAEGSGFPACLTAREGPGNSWPFFDGASTEACMHATGSCVPQTRQQTVAGPEAQSLGNDPCFIAFPRREGNEQHVPSTPARVSPQCPSGSSSGAALLPPLFCCSIHHSAARARRQQRPAKAACNAERSIDRAPCKQPGLTETERR